MAFLLLKGTYSQTCCARPLKKRLTSDMRPHPHSILQLLRVARHCGLCKISPHGKFPCHIRHHVLTMFEGLTDIMSDKVSHIKPAMWDIFNFVPDMSCVAHIFEEHCPQRIFSLRKRNGPQPSHGGKDVVKCISIICSL